MRRGARITGIVAAATALSVTGCAGVAAPQTSFRDSQKLGVATSAISTACGEMYQLHAFAPPPQPSDIDALRSSARAAVQKLAGVYRTEPSSLFLGASVATIVNQARTMLRACGLEQAAEQLKRATARR